MRSPRIMVGMPTPLYNRVVAFAKAEGLTLSGAVALLVRRALAGMEGAA